MLYNRRALAALSLGCTTSLLSVMQGRSAQSAGAAKGEMTFSANSPGVVIELPAGDLEGEVSIVGRGTSGQPVIVRPAEPFQTRFLGTVRLEGKHVHIENAQFEGGGRLVVEGHGQTVRNCRFVNGGPERAIMLRKGRGQRVENCLVRGWNGFGISARGNAREPEIRRCLFDNRGMPAVPGAAVQLGLGRYSAYRSIAALVEECRFVGWAVSRGFDKVLTIKSSDNHVRFCTFENCDARVQVRLGARNTFEGCHLDGVRALRILDADNRVLGCRIKRSTGASSSGESGLVIAGGNLPSDESWVDNGAERIGHPHADRTHIAGCDVDHTHIGSHYRGQTLPANATIVRDHVSASPIRLVDGFATNSDIQIDAAYERSFARWRYLDDADVGPTV